jgi:acetyl-CoA carboxylase carboxyl transferase subunit beta
MPAARELIDAVADPGSFEPWDADLRSWDPLAFSDTRPYGQRLAEASARAGTNESVLTGAARLRGRAIVLVTGEFGFMAGSIGVATGELVARAFERATQRRLPVLAMPVSGGTRMQEGTLAFLQMVKTTVAIRRFREQGLCYVAYLRHPTMGGVLASWASLAHVIFAEPGALIGFTGPRVIEQTTGEPLPEGIQVAEHLCDHGLIDDVVPPRQLAERVATVLAVTAEPAEPAGPGGASGSSGGDARVGVGEPAEAWASIACSRRADRPGAGELLARASQLTPLRGDRAGQDDAGCVAALARLRGLPVVVVAQQRRAGERGPRLSAAGYRKARRAMLLADELGLPLVTVIDTPGAQLSRQAEEEGLASELARCIDTMTALRSPTLTVLLGEGSGGGALALFPADRVIAAEHGWLSPIAPEGASAILYRSADRAPELAAAQGASSAALAHWGIVDEVVAEDGCAADPSAFLDRLAAAATGALRALVAEDPDQRLARRHERYRTVGDRRE